MKKVLYATSANGSHFVKQAASPAQFRMMCCKDEEASGWYVQPRFRHQYNPDFFYDRDRKAWVDMDTGETRAKLPWQ